MKNPNELSYEELVDIVESIRDTLYFDVEEDRYNPELEWEVDSLDYIAETLRNARLTPEGE